METEKEIRLAALRKSISEMSDEELREKMKESRNNRKAPEKVVKTKSLAQRRKSKASVKKVETEISELSPEEAAILLAKLKRPSDA